MLSRTSRRTRTTILTRKRSLKRWDDRGCDLCLSLSFPRYRQASSGTVIIDLSGDARSSSTGPMPSPSAFITQFALSLSVLKIPLLEPNTDGGLLACLHASAPSLNGPERYPHQNPSEHCIIQLN